jgi:hypothetical protein
LISAAIVDDVSNELDNGDNDGDKVLDRELKGDKSGVINVALVAFVAFVVLDLLWASLTLVTDVTRDESRSNDELVE